MTIKRIAIIGTGLTGLSAAIYLATPSTQVELYGLKSKAQNRQLILSMPNATMLAQLLGQEITGTHLTQVHLSSQNHWGFCRFDSNHHNLKYFGQMINASLLQETLWTGIKQQNNITHHCNNLNSIDDLDHDCIILATGQNDTLIPESLSQVRTGKNITIHQSIWTTEQHITPHTAWQRFSSTGVWALVPISKNQVKCIHTSTQNVFADPLLAWRPMIRLKDLVHEQTFGYTTSIRPKSTLLPYLCLGECAIMPPPIAAQHLNFTLKQLKILRESIDVDHFTNGLKQLDINNEVFFKQQHRLLHLPKHLAGIGFSLLNQSKIFQQYCLNRFMGEHYYAE